MDNNEQTYAAPAKRRWPQWLSIIFAGLGLLVYFNRNSFTGISFLLLVISGLCWLLAAFFLLFGNWRRPGLIKACRILKLVWIIGMALLLLSFGLVQGAIWRTAAAARDDAAPGRHLLVLGAGLYGEMPSAALVSRLQGALAYLKQNPESRAVLAGGQGPGEDISEALAMQRWLLAYGIDEWRLIIEDKSTSTAENIAFAQPLLTEHGLEQVTIVSSDFHLYRAGLLAKHYGLDAELIGRPVPKLGLIPQANYLREYFAVVKELLVLKLFPGTLP